MHVLQWTLVIMGQCEGVLGLDKEEIVQTRMPHIVSQRPDQSREDLQRSEHRAQARQHQQAIHGVAHVAAVVVVVVGVLDILLRYLAQEQPHGDHGHLEADQQAQRVEQEDHNLAELEVWVVQHI